jgi:3-phenylpropionate/trans-cinnamate dioxygenase ferredoxin subunit
MSDLIEISNVNGLKDGYIKTVSVNGRELMVTKVGDSFYCAEARCPHMSGDLSKGALNGTILTCPLHGSQFDLKDGSVVRWTDWTGIKASISRAFKAPRPLKTYPVKVEGDKVFVSVD